MKIFKRIIYILIGIFVIILITMLIAMANLKYKTSAIQNDYSSIYTSNNYEQEIMLNNVEVITQDISCGYAVIEMFANWNNMDLTEEKLYEKYGKVITSTGKSFCEEMNKQFPQYSTTMYKYLSNTELIDKVYNSLLNGVPVPFEWSAKYNDEWTLHYSLIIGIDIPNDRIVIANPYGYIEDLTIKEFIDRTSFEAYENMPIFLKLGFAFGIFEKNTIFIVEDIKNN